MSSSTKAMVAAIVVASVMAMATHAAKAGEVSSNDVSIKLLPKPCHLKGVEGINQGVLLGYGKPIQGCWSRTENIIRFSFDHADRRFLFTIKHETVKNVNDVESYRLQSITSR